MLIFEIQQLASKTWVEWAFTELLSFHPNYVEHRVEIEFNILYIDFVINHCIKPLLLNGRVFKLTITLWIK